MPRAGKPDFYLSKLAGKPFTFTYVSAAVTASQFGRDSVAARPKSQTYLSPYAYQVLNQILTHI